MKLESDSIVVFNQLGYNRTDIVEVDMGSLSGGFSVYNEHGHLLPVQKAAGCGNKNIMVFIAL